MVSIIEDNFDARVTYKWYEIGKVPPDAYVDISQKELHGVLNSDVFLALLPGKKGTHTELGIAIATVPKVILIGETEHFSDQDPDNYPSIFYFLPMVNRYTYDGSLEDLFKITREAFNEAIQR